MKVHYTALTFVGLGQNLHWLLLGQKLGKNILCSSCFLFVDLGDVNIKL